MIESACDCIVRMHLDENNSRPMSTLVCKTSNNKGYSPDTFSVSEPFDAPDIERCRVTARQIFGVPTTQLFNHRRGQNPHKGERKMRIVIGT